MIDGASTLVRTWLRRVPASAYVLLALFVVVALVAPRFLTIGNLINVARVAAILALAAYGQSIVIVTGGLDFSVGSSVALVSVVTILTASAAGTPIGVALGAGTALAIGAFNGLFVSRFELPPFLVTLGALIGFHGLASLLAGGIPLEAPAGVDLSWLGQGTLAGVPTPIVAAGIGFIVLQALMGRTTLGRSWYLIGASIRSARVAGLPVRRDLFLAYLAAGGFAAIAGLILTSRVNSGQPNLFPTLPFEAIAACAIGGLPLAGGAGRPSQVLIGVLVVAVIGNAVVLLNLPSAAQLMTIGVLTVVAVLTQQIKWPPLAAAIRRAGGSRRSGELPRGGP